VGGRKRGGARDNGWRWGCGGRRGGRGGGGARFSSKSRKVGLAIFARRRTPASIAISAPEVRRCSAISSTTLDLRLPPKGGLALP
jgi:hypothetical protein